MHPRLAEPSEYLAPQRRVLLEAARARPTRARERERLRDRSASPATGSGEIPHTHARLGELDLDQCILAVAEHEKRHTSRAPDVTVRLAPAT